MKRRIQGFSLLEIILCIVIISVFSLMTFPQLGDFFAKADHKIVQTKLYDALMLTRDEALAYRQTILLKPNPTWSEQISIVLQDEQKTKLRDIKLNAKGKLHWRSFTERQAGLYLSPQGLLSDQNGTFWYCNAHAKDPVWAMVINKAGRIRVQQQDKYNQLLDARGIRLRCEKD